jgi:UDP-glucose 4-epimerase
VSRRVLVTGGAGFIGSHVAAAYVEAGDEVTVLDDLSTGTIANVPRGARFVRADIRSSEARELLATGGFTLLNHHAAQVDVRASVADPVRDAEVNLVGLLNLLDGARAGDVRRVIFASSGGAMYLTEGLLPLGEGAAKLPLSPYGSAKLASEYYLATFARLYDLTAVVLRYSNVYGPRQNGAGEGGVVAVFAHRLATGQPVTIFGDGLQTRDFVYVGDVAEANLLASECDVSPLQELDSRAFNIGTGIETGVRELAELLAAALGREVEVRYQPARAGELRRSALAIDKAVSALGWRPRTSLREGLAATLRAITGAKGGGAGSRRTDVETTVKGA